MMNRHVSAAQIGEFCKKMDISFPEAHRHLIERVRPSVNNDLE
jgi:hypothetical protein